MWGGKIPSKIQCPSMINSLKNFNFMGSVVFEMTY